MDIELTAATRRVLDEASTWCSGSLLQAPAVLLGLLLEPECRAALILHTHGIDAATVKCRWPGLLRTTSAAPSLASDSNEGTCGRMVPRFSAEMETAVAIAREWLADLPRPLALATEHLLMGLAAGEDETGSWLRQKSIHADILRDEILKQYGLTVSLPEIEPPIPGKVVSPAAENPPQTSPKREVASRHQDSQRSVKLFDPGEQNANVVRLLDASANRAREALRVVEDYVRFVLDDEHLTERLKTLRHKLTSALAELPISDRLAVRDTQADVGTTISTDAERVRQGAADVLTANFTRLQEALRSLEEFGKIDNVVSSQVIEQLRYETYTLHKAVQGTAESLNRLDGTRLYVLVDGRSTVEAFDKLVASLVQVGVDVIQLRDKTLADRELLERARRLRDLTASSDTLFVMNDRPDLAVLAAADGVHVGQEELTVRDVRQIVGPRMLVGVSTHNLDQARQAVLDGASYLGVGPTFPSGTKSFNEFPGVEFARSVTSEIRLPAFAIGGIDALNLDEVLAAGIGRVAVSGAVVAAKDPADAARTLLNRLKAGTA